MVHINTRQARRSARPARVRYYPGMEAVRILCWGFVAVAIANLVATCAIIWMTNPGPLYGPAQDSQAFYHVDLYGLALLAHSFSIVLFSFLASFIKVLLDIQDNTYRASRQRD